MVCRPFLFLDHGGNVRDSGATARLVGSRLALAEWASGAPAGSTVRHHGV